MTELSQFLRPFCEDHLFDVGYTGWSFVIRGVDKGCSQWAGRRTNNLTDTHLYF